MLTALQRCLSSFGRRRGRSSSRSGYNACGAPIYGGKTCPKPTSPSFTCYWHPNWKDEQDEETRELRIEQERPRLSEVLKNAREMKAGKPEPRLGELFATIRENSVRDIKP